MGREKKKAPKESYETSIKVNTITYFMIIVGLVLVIVCNIPKEDYLVNHAAQSVLVNIGIAVGTTLLSAGLVSVIVEISTIKGIVEKAFRSILSADIPLESYSVEKLQKIGKAIAAKRGSISDSSIDNSIYSLEPLMVALLDKPYYEYYNANYVIYPKNDEGYFHKVVELKYEIVNKNHYESKIQHTISFFYNQPDITDEELKSRFKVSKFCINGHDYLETVKEYIHVTAVKTLASSTYQYNVALSMDLSEAKETKHKVEITMEYDVPIDDLTQIFRMTYPCKRLEHKIFMDNDKCVGSKWKAHGVAFTSFYCKQDESEKGFIVEQKVDSTVIVSFKNWIIPGAGYVMYFSKK